jgi:hypothetical protein
MKTNGTPVVYHRQRKVNPKNNLQKKLLLLKDGHARLATWVKQKRPPDLAIEQPSKMSAKPSGGGILKRTRNGVFLSQKYYSRTIMLVN